MNRLSLCRLATFAACALTASAAMAQDAALTGGTPMDAQAPSRVDMGNGMTGQGQPANPAGRSPQADADLSLDCPPTAAGRMPAARDHQHGQRSASSHRGTRQSSADDAARGASTTPLTDKREQARLRQELSQCTSQADRAARAECARQAWEAREAPPSPESVAAKGSDGGQMAAMRDQMDCR